MTEAHEERQIVVINNIPPLDAQKGENLRAISLYGDITEEKASDIVNGLVYLESTSRIMLPEDPNDPDSVLLPANQDIRFFISTHGGVASDMFAIIDVMRMIQKNTCDIETIAIGKIMSAGVPLLAAGSKGKRKIGRNCRVMLHNVMAGYSGTILNMENELEEIKWIQDRYIDCLTKSTKLTKAKIRKMLRLQSDVYLSAEDAIKYGIADIIF